MKKFYLVGLVLLATVLGAGAVNCESAVQHGANNPAQYQRAGQDVYRIAKDTEIDNASTIQNVGNVVDSIQRGVGAVSFIPGVSSYATPITVGLGLLSGVLGIFGYKKNEKVKVETKKADNYREAIEIGISEGTDSATISVAVLEKVLNTDSKIHFNETGKSKL